MKIVMKIAIFAVVIILAANLTSYADQTEFGPLEVKVHVRNNVNPCGSLREKPTKEETSEKSDIIKTAPSFQPGFPMLAGENIMFMWEEVSNAVKYRIYEDGKILGDASEPSFTYAAPSKIGKYKYTIVGIDSEGMIGPVSKESVISIIKFESPGGISCNFEIKDKPMLTIKWDLVLNVVIYDIYRAENIDGPWKPIAAVTATKYVDTDLSEDGFHYFYKVQPDNKTFHFPESDILEVKYK